MPPTRDFLPPARETRAFERMRRRMFAARVRQMFARSRFRATLIALLTSLLGGGTFWMFKNGFVSLQSALVHSDTFATTVGSAFTMFFLALMPLLVFSAGVILYSSLFRTREIAFLLTIPARTGRVFLHEFHEAVIMTSWGFLFLGSPILLAYGVVAGAPWYFYAMLPGFFVAFVYIPVALGAIACLLVVRFFPNHLRIVLSSCGLLLAGVVVWAAWGAIVGPQQDLLTPGWLQEVLGRLRILDQRLLPSWWLSNGLLDAAGGAWTESLLFLALLISNALFFRLAAVWVAEAVYRTAYDARYNQTPRRKRPKSGQFDQALSRLLSPLPTTIRLMTIKDVRLFRRDPQQWSQLLIFVAFLLLYFVNIRPFTYGVSSREWVYMISFLNLAVVGLLLSTFTTRFIFPLVSLEGRRFWILGQLGTPRETILWGKFWFAAVSALIPCGILVLLSDAMLRVPWLIMVSHQVTCLTLCMSLAGIAVGFGAWLPSLREDSPSRIAASFGGTLTLVTSTLLILTVVLLTALPAHFLIAAEYNVAVQEMATQSKLHAWLLTWWLVGLAASVVLGVAATLIPLRLGIRNFRKLEF
jgi:ABC-2 type transport system permease protein